MLVDWLAVDIEVLVTATESVATIISVSGKEATLELPDSNAPITVLEADISPVRPEKKNKAKILSGEFKGKTGLVIGIDGQDGIIKFDGKSDFKIVPMAFLAKMK